MLGSAYGSLQYQRFTFTGNVNLHAGLNKISLLSIVVGLPVSSLICIFINIQYLQLYEYHLTSGLTCGSCF